MAVNQEYKEYRVNELPETGYAGDRYYLNVGGGKFQTYIISDALTPVREAGQEFIECDTVDDLRNLDARQIWAIQNGYYKGVTLNGYYSKGDTPAPIDYYLSDTVEEDDGGSVFEVGSIKLQHDFVGMVNVQYFGVSANSNTDQTERVQYVLNKYSKVELPLNGNIYIKAYDERNPPGTNYLIDRGGIYLNSNQELFLNGCTLTAITGGEYEAYNVIRIVNKDNTRVYGGKIDGAKETVSLTTGERGFGIAVQGSRNTYIYDMDVYNCFGDSLDTQPLLPGHAGVETLKNVEHLFIDRFKGHDNRRQGISIESCVHGHIRDTELYNISGTAPQAGIDIEPWASSNLCKDILIENVTIHSCDIGFICDDQEGLGGAVKDITFRNVKVVNTREAFQVSRQAENVTIDNLTVSEISQRTGNITGAINLRVINCSFKDIIIKTSGDETVENAWTTKSVIFNNCSFVDSTIQQPRNTKYIEVRQCSFKGKRSTAGATLLLSSNTQVIQDNVIRDTSNFIQNQDSGQPSLLDVSNNTFIDSYSQYEESFLFNVKNRTSIRRNKFVFNRVPPTQSLIRLRLGSSFSEVTDNDINVNINVSDVVESRVLTLVGFEDPGNNNYSTYNLIKGNSINLPKITNQLNSFICRDIAYDAYMGVGVPFGSNMKNVYKDDKGIVHCRNIQAVPEQVKRGDLVSIFVENESLFVVVDPPVIDKSNGEWSVTTPAVLRRIVNGDYVANTTRKGVVGQAVLQPYSSATDVPGIVSDFNNLLSKLKDAGIMSTI